jgi:predicted GNAT family N-acyltransferase
VYEIRIGYTLSESAKALRAGVFLDEQGFSVEFDEIDDTCLHLEVLDGSEVIAYCRAYEDAEKPGLWHIGRVVVAKEYRGEHLGAMIMNVSAQCRVKGFYASLGYQERGDIYMDEFCPHIRMDKPVSDEQ